MVSNAAKLSIVVVVSAVWFVVYDLTNRHGSDPARMIRLTRPVDIFPAIIQPWTAPIYVFGGAILPLLPFLFHWSWPRLRFVLACYAIASLLAFCCYWLWPVGMLRPAMRGDGTGEALMRLVFAVDKEANCFPSSHVFLAILGAMLVSTGAASRLVRVLTWLLAILVCCTTVTTGQHYFIDILGGIAVALIGFAAARRLLPDALPPNDDAARSRDCTEHSTRVTSRGRRRGLGRTNIAGGESYRPE
jgi:membrane-associated phospholipid phosphatase